MNEHDWYLIVEALEIMRGLSQWFSEEKKSQISTELYRAKAARKAYKCEGEGNVD